MKGDAIYIGALAVFLLSACDEQASEPAEPAEPAPVPAAAEGTPSTAEPAAKAGDPITPTDSAKPATPTKPPPSGHAVVRVGGLMFTTSTGEVGVELPPLGAGTSAPGGLTVNVVGERDGRIEVETLFSSSSSASTPTHCAGSLSSLEHFRLRLYVAPDDLLDVVTTEFTHTFEDDTSVRLMPGTPVLPGEPTTVIAGRTRVQVPVPDEHRGRYYEPGPLLSDEGSKGHIYARAGEVTTYDGNRPLAEEALFRTIDQLAHYGSTKRGTQALVTLRNECLEATATISAERLEHPTPGVVMGLMPSPEIGSEAPSILDESKTMWAVKTGTSIVWSDGEPAGQVTAVHKFATEPKPHDGRSCFDVPLTAEPRPTVTLCFAPADVSTLEGTAALAASSVIGTPGAPGTALGTLGTGGTGGSSGPLVGGLGPGGSKGTTPSTSTSKVKASKPAVKGALDKEVIRRVVRAHINEVRYCYEKQLAKDPGLAGTVSIQFTIGPTGKVPAAVVAKSTFKDKKVEQCVLKRVKRWVFPSPKGGGNAIVTYPFVFKPS